MAKLDKTTTVYFHRMTDKEYEGTVELTPKRLMLEDAQIHKCVMHSSMEYVINDILRDCETTGMEITSTCREKHYSSLHRLYMLPYLGMADRYKVCTVIGVAHQEGLYPYTKELLDKILMFLHLVDSEYLDNSMVKIIYPLTEPSRQAKVMFGGTCSPDLISTLYWLIEEHTHTLKPYLDISNTDSGYNHKIIELCQQLISIDSSRFHTIEVQKLFTVYYLYSFLRGDMSISYYPPIATGPGLSVGGNIAGSLVRGNNFKRFITAMGKTVQNESYITTLMSPLVGALIKEVMNEEKEYRTRIRNLKAEWS